MATISTLEQTTDPLDSNILQVIDGQQRLTTLTLLLAAVHSVLKEHIDELEDDTRTDLTNLSRQLVRKTDKRPRVTPQKQGHNFDDYQRCRPPAESLSRPGENHHDRRRTAGDPEHRRRTLDEWEDDEAGDEAPPMLYGSVLEFFEGMVMPLLRDRRIDPRSGARWAARLWEPPEALIRLDAIWRAYESLRWGPATGISVLLRDHFDVHMSVLMSETGPFAKARDTSEIGEFPPHEAPPEGMFPEHRS